MADGTTEADVKALLQGLDAFIMCGSVLLEDINCSKSSTTRAQLRSAVALPMTGEGATPAEERTLGDERILRLWKTLMGASASDAVRRVTLTFPPRLATNGDHAEYEAVNPVDLLEHNQKAVGPEVGCISVRVQGVLNNLTGCTTRLYVWGGQEQSSIVERALQRIQDELSSRAFQSNTHPSDLLNSLRAFAQDLHGVQVSTIQDLREYDAITEHNGAAIKVIRKGYRARVQLEVGGHRFACDVESVGQALADGQIQIHQLPACMTISGVREPSRFPRLFLPFFQPPAHANLYNYHSSTTNLSPVHDTPTKGAAQFQHYVDHWEGVTRTFQDVIGLENKAFTVIMFHSIKGQKTCVRFCRLRNFFLQYLASHRPSETWASTATLVNWIAENVPRYHMTEAEVNAWCENGKEQEIPRTSQFWSDTVDREALQIALHATAELTQVTWQEVAIVWMNIDDVVPQQYQHPVYGTLKRWRQCPLIQFAGGLYLLASGRVMPWWGRADFTSAVDSLAKVINERLSSMLSDTNKPKVNWAKLTDRALGKSILNSLARSTEHPWAELDIQKDDWESWRNLLLCPSWAASYTDHQTAALEAYREAARASLQAYQAPTKAQLRGLIDSLAAESAAKAAGLTAASDQVWGAKEIVGIALGFLISRVRPQLDESGERSQLSNGVTWVIQRLLPHRTTSSIQNGIFRRMALIIDVYNTVLEIIHLNGLEVFQEELGDDGIELLRQEGVEDEARELAAASTDGSDVSESEGESERSDA